MKYFTRDLLERYGSSDNAVANEADAEWDRATDRYTAHLDALRPRLPAGLLYLFDNFYLHDAEVLSLGRNGTTLVIVVQLDPAFATLVLTYELTEEPRINRAALPPEHCSTHQHAFWMYDEVDLADTDGTAWVQDILLSNGWEVHLRFRGLQVSALHPLLLPDSDQGRLDSALRANGPYSIPPQLTDSVA